MKTLIGVVYDLHTLALRRVVLPDADDQLVHHLGPGEGMVTMPRINGWSHEQCFDAIMRRTGRHAPPMDEVHARDAISRAMGVRVY